MAYLPVETDPGASPLAADSMCGASATGLNASFAPLEQAVISLAEADPVASLGGPRRFSRFFERWFGFRRQNPLSDERLEALRRFAVLARVARGDLPADEVRRFLAAGFSLPQARALQRRAARCGL